jgi:adenylyltransferase/sulfurtransferase
MLSKKEKSHYDRHIKLEGFGEEAQLKLKSARVLVIGAGGIGCPVLQYLCVAGVGHIGIIDGDRVEASNLQRQILFSYDDIGQLKSVVAAQKLSRHNINISLKAYPYFLTKDNALELFSEYDVIVDGSDNFGTRYLTNDACVLAGKPLIFGSLFRFEGQVSVFNYNNGPCYRCLFPEAPKTENVPDCSEAGVIGVLPGIIGSIQALECIKVITGIGDVLSSKVLVYDGLKQNFNVVSFDKNPKIKVEALGDYDIACASKESKSVEEVQSILKQNQSAQFIDVREAEEYSAHNIGALNIPLSELENNLSAIDKEQVVVLHCKSGNRSLKALDILKENQFKKVYSMTGGIEAWN